MDECSSQTFSGRLYNPFLLQAIAVDSPAHLVLAMDRMLDEMKLPQSFTAMRTFVPLKDAPETRFVPGEPTGTRATFAIQLLFRQNTTWQGNLTWLEEGHTHSFASVLELLAFLQNVLSTLS